MYSIIFNCISEIYGIHCIESCVEEFGSLLEIILYYECLSLGVCGLPGGGGGGGYLG